MRASNRRSCSSSLTEYEYYQHDAVFDEQRSRSETAEGTGVLGGGQKPNTRSTPARDQLRRQDDPPAPALVHEPLEDHWVVWRSVGWGARRAG